MSEMEFLVREKRDLKTLLVKLNVAITSFSGRYVISWHQLRQSRYCAAKPWGGLMEILYHHKNGEEDHAKVINSISFFMPIKGKEETSTEGEISWSDINQGLEECKEKIRAQDNLRLHEEITNLGTKLHSKNDDANEKISNLDRRIVVLPEKLRQSIDLESEIVSLRMRNSELSRENLGLILQLEMTQISFSEAEKAIEEANHLRQENENLRKDIEQLKTDQCKDVEQSVYLKWVNACLRYELRDCKSPTGIITAKDLSKSASPNSQEKAKLLILQYASYNAELCSENKNTSSLRAEEHDKTHIEKNRSSDKKCVHNFPNNTKFLSKFGQIIKGKKEERNNKTLVRRKASVACFPFEDDRTMENDGKIFDCKEEIEEVNGKKTNNSELKSEQNSQSSAFYLEKNDAELTRLAEVLKRARTTSKFHYI